MGRTGRSIPEPVSARLVVGDGEGVPIPLDSVLRQTHSGPGEAWFEVVAPDFEESPGRCLLVLDFDLPTPPGTPYLRNGYQSWSYAGISRTGDPVVRPTVDMMVMSHFSHLAPPVPADVLAESESFMTFADFSAFTLDGRSAPACFFATEDRLVLSLDLSRAAPKKGQALDVVALLEYGPGEVLAALERLLAASAVLKRARASAPLYTGWCSWYQYFSNIDEELFLKNLALAEKHLPELEVFQLDDGYQKAIGDWTETNSRFPSGIEALARRVADAGFVPGIWIAPFVATSEASIYSRHPDWFLKLPNGSPVPAMFNPGWGGNGFAFALDCTNPEVLEWLRTLGRRLREYGFGYVKIDFCYAASMPGRSARRVGRAEALVEGVSALRDGLGEDVFLLGCGIPLWPVVGLVDGMRIGPDVAPHLKPQLEVHGMVDAMPALGNALRNTVARAVMHRRLWTNDPDCVLLRRSQTSLAPDVAAGWAKLVASLGQMFLISDDLSLYSDDDFRKVGDLARLARERDVPAGTPVEVPDPLEDASYQVPRCDAS